MLVFVTLCLFHSVFFATAASAPPGELRLLTIDNSKTAQGMGGVCPDYSATVLELAINHTLQEPEFTGQNLSIRIRVVDGGTTTASYARRVFEQVADFKPCAMFGPFGSLLGDAATLQVGACTSELNVPWVPISDGSAETLSLKDTYTSAINAFGAGLGAGAMLPHLFKMLLQRNIRRLALILPASSVKVTSKIAEEAKYQGMDVSSEFINIESATSETSLKGEFTAAFNRIKARRYSNIAMFLTRLNADFADWVYDEADRIGLACKGCQWYMSCGGGMNECPYELNENRTTTKHRSFVGARTIEVWSTNPPSDTEDINVYKSVFLSIFPRGDAFLKEAREFYVQNFGKYVGVEGGSCGYSSPQEIPDWFGMIGYVTALNLRLFLKMALRAHLAGYCSAPLWGTKEGLRRWKELTMAFNEVDPERGLSQFECGARGTYTSLENCTTNPSRKMMLTERIVGDLYPPYIMATPTNRFMGIVSLSGKYLPYDGVAGMPSDTVSMMFTGQPTKWQNGATTPPRDFLPDSCGDRAYINETAPDRACVSCPRGSGNPMDGSNACSLEVAERCDAGTIWVFAEKACKACFEGTFAKQDGLTECTACAPGTFAGARASLQCTDCPAGYVAPAAGSHMCTPCKRSFWRRAAGEPCMSCGLGETTEEVATDSQAGCLCEPGRLRLLDGSCAPCNAVASECPGLAQEASITSKLFFSLESRGDGSKVPVSYACMSKEDCPGGFADGSCPDRRDGVACGACAPGFARSGGQCVDCQGSTQGRGWWAAGAFAAFVLVCAAILRVLSRRDKVYISAAFAISTIWGIFINFMQLSGQLVLVSIEWPRGSSDALKVSGFITFDISAIQFGCIFGDSVALRFGTKFFIVIAALMVTLTLTVLAEVYDRLLARPDRKLNVGLEGLINAWGIFANTAFVPMAMQGFSMFNCYRHPEIGASMKDLPAVLCYQPSWSRDVLPIGVLCLMFTAATFSMFLWVVLLVPRVPGFAMRYRFLFRRFRPECYYWNLIILLRNLAFALCPSLAPDNSFVVTFLIGCVCCLYLGVLIARSPWKYPLHVRLDTAAIMALNLTVNVGVGFTRTPTYGTTLEPGSDWTFLKVCAALPFLIVALITVVASINALYRTRNDTRPSKLDGMLATLRDIASQLGAVFRATKVNPQLGEDLRRNMENLSLYDIADIERAKVLIQDLCLGGGSSQGDRSLQSLWRLASNGTTRESSNSGTTATSSLHRIRENSVRNIGSGQITEDDPTSLQIVTV